MERLHDSLPKSPKRVGCAAGASLVGRVACSIRNERALFHAAVWCKGMARLPISHALWLGHCVVVTVTYTRGWKCWSPPQKIVRIKLTSKFGPR